MGMSIVPRGLQVDLVMALDLYLHIIYILTYIHLNLNSMDYCLSYSNSIRKIQLLYPPHNVYTWQIPEPT